MCVDGLPVVTADRSGEGDVQDFRRHVMSKLAETLLVLLLAPLLLPAALLLVAAALVIVHCFPPARIRFSPGRSERALTVTPIIPRIVPRVQLEPLRH